MDLKVCNGLPCVLRTSSGSELLDVPLYYPADWFLTLSLRHIDMDVGDILVVQHGSLKHIKSNQFEVGVKVNTIIFYSIPMQTLTAFEIH